MKTMISAMFRLAKAMQNPLFRHLASISIKLDATLNYQLPKSTITDHLKDCFGWLTEKRPYYKRFRCMNKKMAGRMSANHYYKRGSAVPSTTYFVEHHDELAG